MIVTFSKHDHQMQMSPMLLPFPSSDLHFWKHGSIGECVVEDDYVLGHEGAGTIVSVGSNVSGLSKSDRVAIKPGVPCGTCALCEDGRYNLCRRAFLGCTALPWLDPTVPRPCGEIPAQVAGEPHLH
ncbi:chaperonin 10-like protein [Cryomyces antarcticus]